VRAQCSAVRTAIAILLLLFASSVQGAETTGRVRALYYEAARGVLVEAKMLHGAGATRWADVEAEGRRLLVRVPAGMSAAVGDLVAVRLADPKSSQLAQILPAVAVNRAFPIDAPGASAVGR
jgi:hypothetical protein